MTQMACEAGGCLLRVAFREFGHGVQTGSQLGAIAQWVMQPSAQGPAAHGRGAGVQQ